MLAIVGAVAAVAAADVQAQVQFEVTPVGGGTFFLADPPERFALGRTQGQPATIIQNGAFADAWTLGLNAGVRLNERWGFEGMFTWLPTELSATSGLAQTEKVNGYMYGITALYYLPVEARVTPFLGLGFGAETFDYETSSFETETELMGNAVLGLYVQLREGLGVRLEARDCIAHFNSGIDGVKHGWENDLMTTVGLSFRVPS
jgi:opacity protein-like surface antigen